VVGFFKKIYNPLCASMPTSYLSPKTKIKKSRIEGYGLFTVKSIRKEEIVAIKGGHILDKKTLWRVEDKIEASYIQIDDNFYIGAIKKSEIRNNKMFINHSCEPNLGIRGQVTFVAMRGIKAGEELTYDWAMEENDPEKTKCNCGTKNCRKILTGVDWKKQKLQKRYRGYFSAYIQSKIRGLRGKT